MCSNEVEHRCFCNQGYIFNTALINDDLIKNEFKGYIYIYIKVIAINLMSLFEHF